MHKKKRSLILLSLAFISFIMEGYLILHFPPAYHGKILRYTFSIVVPFFILFFLFLYSFLGFVLRNSSRGMRIGIFFCCYLLLRLFGLTQLLFFLLLLALFVVVELFFLQKK